MSKNCEVAVPSLRTEAHDSLKNCQEVSEESSCSKDTNMSDEENLPSTKIKRVTIFSDSDTDVTLDKKNKGMIDSLTLPRHFEGSVVDDSNLLNNGGKKSRIKLIDTSESEEDKRNLKKSVRTQHKFKKLKDKFKGLLSNEKSSQGVDTHNSFELPKSDFGSNEDSDEESCLNIKEKIKKSLHTMKSICDPDSSDEENNIETNHKQKSRLHKPKSTKPTSPKPIKMSAKQAQENMHKIKSESNRMLREKQVSLPYHRPKALSLKDIMSRRRPAVAADGKALPIKMNSEQLKQYVLLLEQRQKEVIELCKSDTEEEEDENDTIVENNIPTDTTMNVVNKSQLETTNKENEAPTEISSNNETSCTELITHDNITMVPTIEELGSVNCIQETNCNETNALDTSYGDPEKQTDCLMETENVNEPIKMDIDNEYNETDIINTSTHDKEHKKNITLETTSEGQSIKTFETNTGEKSQNIKLCFDSEREIIEIRESELKDNNLNNLDVPTTSVENQQTDFEQINDDEFLNNDFNYDEIDELIENTKIPCDGIQKGELDKNEDSFSKPKLTGAPGMVIDLDNTDPLAPKQLSGVDLLKERFTYFAKLKSLEDMEKDREKKFKPGLQHLKLKQELEEQIAEQRSIEWEKRLEEEKRLKSEINGHFSDDDIEKLETKLEDTNEKLDDNEIDSESSEGEEEPIENDILLEDKQKKRNPLVDDEAEESECDEEIHSNDEGNAETNNVEDDDGDEADLEDDNDDTSDSSSESEEEVENKPKKGRILKAFEDSDDESVSAENVLKNNEVKNTTEDIVHTEVFNKCVDNDVIKDSQDDELQLAQEIKSSDDLFTTQESDKQDVVLVALNKNSDDNVSADLGTQTFSILDSLTTNQTVNLNSPEKTLVSRTHTLNDDLNLLVGACVNSSATQNTTPQFSQTQEIGDDVIALCTGKFYDNPFVSQVDKNKENSVKLSESSQSQDLGDIAPLCTGHFYDNLFVSKCAENSEINKSTLINTNQIDKDIMMVDNTDTENPNDNQSNVKNDETSILSSILEELDGPDFERPKNKYFPSNNQSGNKNNEYSQVKKKLVIDSDDETNDGISQKKNKKLKKRKAEDRALQISDDEEETEIGEDQSDIESEANDDGERIVEYDSEENEVEVQQKISTKKRVGGFFEDEAEMTSEDEWVGSGDEDERGLDRMEREEGDDETFHQGKLQREIGQIHMREVLDQDKREVRMIQELLFEDGDLGDGHRKRKFRWRNADGEEELGTNPNEFIDTQEEEFESEEQWRKQRHEREMFLRKLQEKDDADFDTSINRTAIIKANLTSKSMSMLLSESKGEKNEKDNTVVPDKKPAKDIPSPKKSFTIFQQNYHGSLLTRGRGALARLAALATPLATDDDAPKVITTTNRRNFVFTALSQQEEKPKVTKRKADTNVNTPRLIKKMKTEDPHKHYKSTLFDRLKS